MESKPCRDEARALTCAGRTYFVCYLTDAEGAPFAPFPDPGTHSDL